MDTLKLNQNLLVQFEHLDKKAQEKEQERVRLENKNKDRAREHLLQIQLLLTRQQPIRE